MSPTKYHESNDWISFFSFNNHIALMGCFLSAAGRWQAVDLPATGFIPVVLGILHYSKALEIPVVQNPENH